MDIIAKVYELAGGKIVYKPASEDGMFADIGGSCSLQLAEVRKLPFLPPVAYVDFYCDNVLVPAEKPMTASELEAQDGWANPEAARTFYTRVAAKMATLA